MATSEKKSVEKPLWRTIASGCFLFIFLLCIILGITSWLNYRRSLYQRYEAYIADILNYVDRHIDDDDLAQCIQSLERSEKFDQLEKFMDGIKEDFDIHYLYILIPIHKNGAGRIMSVISAENNYDRNIDTEGNLYLGWISDDEYDEKTVEKLFTFMNTHEIVYYEEKTEWGKDYTGSLTLYNSQKKSYALLCVDVDISEISRLVRKRTIETFAVIIVLGFIFTLFFLLWIRKNVTTPISMLEECVVAFAEKSHGQRDLQELEYVPPLLETKNEVYQLSEAVSQMTTDMRDYVEGIILAERNVEIMQQHASHMTELANQDSLTGIRNKTAYDRTIRKMEYELDMGSLTNFGLAMIDLNNLKVINDTYGHEEGNFAIKKLCELVCNTFVHSPVFRIGGDEFVVILRGSDFAIVYSLIANFKHELFMFEKDESLKPWEKISAALGFAEYDKAKDKKVADVFKRADQKMYEDKKEMKAKMGL